MKTPQLNFALSAFAVTLTLFVGSLSTAHACEQQEMQFFGKVRNVQIRSAIVGADVCSYQIQVVNEPLEPRPSLVCPLSPGEGETLTFLDQSCTKKDGDLVSGIMVRTSNAAWVE